MVDASVRSVLAQYEDEQEFDLDAGSPQRSSSRFAGTRREQPSRTRFATEARYSRRRTPGAPSGPRRRQSAVPWARSPWQTAQFAA